MACCIAVVLALSGCDVFVSNETRIERAEQLIVSGAQREAVIELKNVLDDEPANARALTLLATAMYQLEDVQGANAELQRAIDAGAPREDLAEIEGMLMIWSRRFKELEQRLESGSIVADDELRSVLMARAKFGQGDPEGAKKTLNDALARQPDSAEVMTALAEVLAATGEQDAALDHLEKLLAKDPRNARALLNQGLLLVQLNQLDAAEKSYTAALQHGSATLTFPQRTMAAAALVEIQLAKGDVPGAERANKTLTELAPESFVSRLLGARILLSKQEYAAATAELQRIVTQAPQFVPARALLGASLFSQGSYEQAERQLAEAVRQAPENIEARKLLAQVRLRMNRPAEAMDTLVPALNDEATDTGLNVLASNVQLRMGDESAAVALLERSVAASPANRELKLQLASAYLRTGYSAKAVELLRQVDAVENTVDKEALLVAALAESKGMSAAQQEVQSLLREHPRNVAILNLASAFFIRSGELQSARDVLARASSLDPKNRVTLTNSARLEIAAGRIGAAEGILKQILEADPTNAPAQLELAALALQQGKTGEALAGLEQLAKRDPKSIEARLALARVHLIGKKPEQAEKEVAAALAVAPDKGAVQNAAGSLYMQFGRMDAALAAFRAAVAADPSNVSYLVSQAQAETTLGQTEAARTTAARALAAEPTHIPAVALNALLDVQAQRPDAALARIDTLKKLRPSDPAVLALEGDVLLTLKRYEQAAAVLEQASAGRASARLAVKLYQARQLAKLPNSLQPLESWLERYPGDLTVRRLLANAYQQTGRREKAIVEYEFLAAQAPGDAMSLNNLAWLQYEAGDARAAQTGAAAYQLAPNNPAVADTYGWILLHRSEVARAVEILAAAAKGSDEPEIRYHYAAALAKSGARDQAREILTALVGGAKAFASRADAERLLRELTQPSA
jgi:putative PEP-CTERM system TPR-repeat lipoprotein